jgi:hypothetical protein
MEICIRNLKKFRLTEYNLRWHHQQYPAGDADVLGDTKEVSGYKAFVMLTGSFNTPSDLSTNAG